LVALLTTLMLLVTRKIALCPPAKISSGAGRNAEACTGDVDLGNAHIGVARIDERNCLRAVA